MSKQNSHNTRSDSSKFVSTTEDLFLKKKKKVSLWWFNVAAFSCVPQIQAMIDNKPKVNKQ